MALFTRSTDGADEPIHHALRGDAVVLESVGSLPMSFQNVKIGGFSRWLGSVSLQVRLPGRPVWYPSPTMWMSRAKYPLAGSVVPVTVDANDLSRVRIRWDEVPTIDEWIATGHPIFTDPDAVEKFCQEAVQARLAAITAEADRSAGAAVDQLVVPGNGEQVQRALAGVRAGLPAQETGLRRRVIKGASARVIAVGWENTDDGDSAWRNSAEMLLSVLVPGQPRYGVRWRGGIPSTKIAVEGWDLPVTVDPRHPRKVEINWDAAGGFDVIADRMSQANDRMAAQLAAPPAPTVDAYQGLLGAIADPVRRAQAEQQIAQALNQPTAPASSPPMTPPPDPLVELERLGQQRAAGTISDEDFAAQKARILGSM